MAERYESELLAALHQVFASQKQHAIDSFERRNQIGKSYSKKDWLNDSTDDDHQNEYMAALLVPIIVALMIETGQDAMRQVGRQPSSFNPSSDGVQGYVNARTTKIASDINSETEKQLRASLSQGYEAGETDNQLLARINIVFGAALTYRSDRIARTEVTKAQGTADVEAWKQSGIVEGKEWYTVEDEHTCPFCEQQDGKIIALDMTFYDDGAVITVGDRTQHVTYGDVGEPPLHVACRCMLIPTLIRTQTS